MAIVYWSDKQVTKSLYSHEPFSFDIHDWRMMKYGNIHSNQHSRSELCTLISAKENIRVIPHIKIHEILEINALGRDHRVNRYHFGYRGATEAITYCFRCKGAGKFDWIQSASSSMRYKWGEAPKYFVRDEQWCYVHPEFDNYVFAKALLEPGDTYCSECNGFGIVLDGRLSVFKGMRGIKKRIVQINPNQLL